ncbi:MAG: hypothetical protein IKM88_14075 [Lachnospiraceae bacterium]|nr:hypothetical protein [Lachnospiraceae bacterium]MBR6851350.1 hypothetical protein [Lachnospiraceae bacterium]
MKTMIMFLLSIFPIIFMMIAYEEYQSLKKQEEVYVQIREVEKYWLSTHID